MKTLLTTTSFLILLTFFSCSKKADDPAPTPAYNYVNDLVGTYIGDIFYEWSATQPFYLDQNNANTSRHNNEIIVITKVNETTIHVAKKISTGYMDEFNVNVTNATAKGSTLTIPHQIFGAPPIRYIDQAKGVWINNYFYNLTTYDATINFIEFLEQATLYDNGTYYIKKFVGAKQ